MIVDARLRRLALGLLPLASVVLATTGGQPLPHLLAAAAIWWLGGGVLAATGALIPALLAQSAPLALLRGDPLTVLAVAALAAASVALLRAEDDIDKDRAALAAGLALGLGIGHTLAFAALAGIPLLLLDRRRLIVTAAATGIAALAGLALLPAAPPVAPAPGAWVVLAAGLAGAALMLAIYFRLRRRGLMAPNRFARILFGMAAAQVVLTVTGAPAAPALLLGGPVLAALWSLSQPLFPGLHPRTWGAVLAVVLVLQTAW